MRCNWQCVYMCVPMAVINDEQSWQRNKERNVFHWIYVLLGCTPGNRDQVSGEANKKICAEIHTCTSSCALCVHITYLPHSCRHTTRPSKVPSRYISLHGIDCERILCSVFASQSLFPEQEQDSHEDGGDVAAVVSTHFPTYWWGRPSTDFAFHSIFAVQFIVAYSSFLAQCQSVNALQIESKWETNDNIEWQSTYWFDLIWRAMNVFRRKWRSVIHYNYRWLNTISSLPSLLSLSLRLSAHTHTHSGSRQTEDIICIQMKGNRSSIRRPFIAEHVRNVNTCGHRASTVRAKETFTEITYASADAGHRVKIIEIEDFISKYPHTSSSSG